MGVKKVMTGGLLGKSSGNFSSALKKPPSLREGAFRSGSKKAVERVGTSAGGWRVDCSYRLSRARRKRRCECEKPSLHTHKGVPAVPTIITSHSNRLSFFGPTDTPSGGLRVSSATNGMGVKALMSTSRLHEVRLEIVGSVSWSCRAQ